MSDPIRLLLLRVADGEGESRSIQTPSATDCKGDEGVAQGRSRRFGTVKELFWDIQL